MKKWILAICIAVTVIGLGAIWGEGFVGPDSPGPNVDWALYEDPGGEKVAMALVTSGFGSVYLGVYPEERTFIAILRKPGFRPLSLEWVGN